MYEFDPSFNVNTGSLNQVFSGSGVHLNRDVTFSFGLIDQQANAITSDQQLIDNPLVDSIVFDILDSGGNVIYPAYLSGGQADLSPFLKQTIKVSLENTQKILEFN